MREEKFYTFQFNDRDNAENTIKAEKKEEKKV